MRHTRLFRLMTALFGVWFTFTLVQPNGMSGMMMNESGAAMNMMTSVSTMNAPVTYVSATNTSATDTATTNPSLINPTQSTVSDADMSMDHSADQMAAMHQASTETVAENGSPKQSTKPAECDQHDCCCSALSPISLMPVAALSWLPENVVNQETPRTGDCVVHTDGQLRLPFANGPPRPVTA